MTGDIPPGAGTALRGSLRDSGSARRGWRLALAGALGSSVSAIPFLAHAQERGGGTFGTFEVIQLAVFAGITGAAMLSAIWLIRERQRTAAENLELRGRVAELGSGLQRAESLLSLNDQRVVLWAEDGRKPDLIGTLPPASGAPDDRAHFLAFGRWLEPRSAAELERGLAELRDRGTDFDLAIETLTGTLFEAQGRHSAANRILRIRALSAAERHHARLKVEHQRTAAERDNLLGLANALAMPFWMRGPDGRLQWVNHAYAAAVEAESPVAAVQEQREFLGTQAREAIARQQKTEQAFAQKLATVVRGDRRMYTVTDHAGREGSAGLAVDISDIEGVREQYERMVRSHADTLDQLTTAVAIFDSERKLRFFNHAFQKLWELDIVFLESAPDHALVLDRLRSEGKLAEQPEWRKWKENLLASYRSVESHEHWWHLPDRRAIRVVANPQANGGVTWIFEDHTEKIDLQSRYNTAVRVQGETLDNLAEGVAVFGPDGRLRLANPAFSSLWGIDAALVQPGMHISAVRALCQGLAVDSPWGEFVAAATGFDDERRDRHGQVELRSGSVLRYAVVHLPNGQAMLTFVDVTDSVNVERALKDKNEALEKTDRLKSEFVQHVSYELRAPLTSIIGFTELLGMPQTGSLNEKQGEYLGYIDMSSAELRTIVDDILDLATLDAGAMALEIGEIPVRRAVEAAVELAAPRFAEHRIRVELDLGDAPALFHGDEQRVRQILFNLLANAANFAPEGSTVRLAARPWQGGVELSVHDDGPGMPSEVLETLFRRFEPRNNGGRRRGAGLGLSIVKSFVELHGGAVEIDSGAGRGTTVTCRFPAVPEGMRAAAE